MNRLISYLFLLLLIGDISSGSPLSSLPPTGSMIASADGFDDPVKPRSNYRVDLDFLQCYENSYHPGEDLNRGSGDNDLNDPVYAIANGTVVASNYYTPRWGNIILIKHDASQGSSFTLPDGRRVNTIWSQYAHLNERKYVDGRSVNVGDEVQKGRQIGKVGKGAGNIFSAHLHFEIRYQFRSADAWTSGCTESARNTILQYYVDPTDFINNNRQVGPNINIWHAQYFDRAQNWDNPSCRTEDFAGPVLNKNWGGGGPCSRTDDFSARFTGTFNFPSGNYVFHIIQDDGAKLYLDGRNIWDSGNAEENNVCSLANETISGNHTLELKFWENSANARIYLDWSTNTSICPPSDTVTVFENSDYLGTQYGGHDERWFQLPDYMDNRASSIVIRAGWSARVFDDPNGSFELGYRCYDSSDANLSDDVFSNGVPADNKISSVSIYHQETCPPPPPPPGDANADRRVDGVDYAIWLSHYGQTTSNGYRDGDFNSDGKVDGIDYAIWVTNYGTGLSTSQTSRDTKTVISPQTAPSPPSDVSFSSEKNETNTAVIVSTSWHDNADNESGFMLKWDIGGYSANTFSTLSNPPSSGAPRTETTSAVVAVIPCGAISSARVVRASLSAFNDGGISSAASATGTVIVPACPTRAYLPLLISRADRPNVTPTPTPINTPTSTARPSPSPTRTPTPPNACVDQFNTPSLNPAWTWIDPLGDSSFSLTATPGNLRLYTPDGEHDLYQNFNAPRVVRSISGNFVATTKVTINPQHNYQGAGLLLWQDENNYIRLERTLVQGIDIWYKVDGVYNGIEIPYSTSPVQLRLQRLGNTTKAFYSENGLSWTTAATINFPAATTLQVGLVLINQSQDNPISANFDFFELDHC